jgi:hypothetical protein
MHFSPVFFAYIDPVSGVILLQLFIGGGIGFIARFRHKIWRFFARVFLKQPVEANAAELSAQPLEPIALRAEEAVVADSFAHDQSRNRHEARKAA